MTTQQPRSFATLAAAIIVAGLLVSGTLYFTVGQPPKTVTSIGTSTSTTTETSTMISTISNTASFQTSTTTQTVTTTATLTANSTYTGYSTCSVSGEGQGFYIRALSDSTDQPISDLIVQATLIDNCGSTIYSSPFTTNGTGWIQISNEGNGVKFFLSVTSDGQRDTFSIPIPPEQPEYVTLYLPSGSYMATTKPPTTTSTVTSPATCPSGTACASFAYGPTGHVQVLSVQATQFVCQNCGAVNGQSYLTFQVALENVGNSSIYIAGGTGELSVSIPANSSVVHTVPTQECAGTFTIIELGQGQNYTLYGPPCDDGLDYQVVQAGTVSIAFSFDWTTNPATNTFPDSTAISAEFTFA